MSQDRRLEGDIRMGPCVGVNVDGCAWVGVGRWASVYAASAILVTAPDGICRDQIMTVPCWSATIYTCRPDGLMA